MVKEVGKALVGSTIWLFTTVAWLLARDCLATGYWGEACRVEIFVRIYAIDLLIAELAVGI